MHGRLKGLSAELEEAHARNRKPMQVTILPPYPCLVLLPNALSDFGSLLLNTINLNIRLEHR
jgi:hypothetical protein